MRSARSGVSCARSSNAPSSPYADCCFSKGNAATPRKGVPCSDAPAIWWRIGGGKGERGKGGVQDTLVRTCSTSLGREESCIAFDKTHLGHRKQIGAGCAAALTNAP